MGGFTTIDTVPFVGNISVKPYQVVDSIAIGLSSFKKKYLFGTGNLERLRALVIGNDRITAVSAILEIDETDPMQGLPQPLPANSCSTASARGPV